MTLGPFDFGFLADKGQLLLAGGLGGVVRWLTLRDKFPDGIISIVVGGICAVYLSPLALPALGPMLGAIGMSSDNSASLSGFMIGLGGITVSGIVMDAWRARKRLIDGPNPPPKEPDPAPNPGDGPK